MMPPMTTVASGRWTSAPLPVARAIGTKPEGRHQGRRQHRAQPGHGAPGIASAGDALGDELVDECDHDQAVQDGHAGQGDEADAGGD